MAEMRVSLMTPSAEALRKAREEGTGGSAGGPMLQVKANLLKTENPDEQSFRECILHSVDGRLVGPFPSPFRGPRAGTLMVEVRDVLGGD